MGNRFRLKGFHRYKIPPVLKRETDPLRALIASLFGNGQQGAMFIPQPVVLGQQVLFQDAAGTVPVTADGDPVGLMLDLSGNGNHATQTTSAARPIYRTDGTMHWLQFDGVNQVLTAPSSPDFDEVPITTVHAFRTEEQRTGQYRHISSYPTSSGRHWAVGTGGAGINGAFRVSNQVGASVSDTVRVTLSVADNNPRVAAVTVEDPVGESTIRLNGGFEGTTSTGSAGSEAGIHRLSIGGNGNRNAQVDVYGAIVVQGEVSDTVSTEKYLAKLAGVTL